MWASYNGYILYIYCGVCMTDRTGVVGKHYYCYLLKNAWVVREVMFIHIHVKCRTRRGLVRCQILRRGKNLDAERGTNKCK